MLRLSSRTTAILVCLAVIIGLSKFVDWVGEYLWFEALAYESVFWRIRLFKVGLFVTAFIPVFLYFWINFGIFSALLDLRTLVTALMTGAGRQRLQRAKGADRGLDAHNHAVVRSLIDDATGRDISPYTA